MPRRESKDSDRSAGQNGNSREETAPKQHGKPHRENASRFGGEPGFKKKKRHQDKPARTGHPQHASAAKPAFGKKAKEHRRG
jgi:ATP-dependent RNA helicase DeaD